MPTPTTALSPPDVAATAGGTGTATRLRVDIVGGRHRVRTRSGLLRAQQLHGPDDRARVALVGQTALLLGGDRVVIAIDVGAGARLELIEVAGTVAYHGRGLPASWTTRIRLAEGAHLTWAGEPFVVADGADVARSTTIELADRATATIRETIVLGRAGERGGVLRALTSINRTGRPVLLEDVRLDPDDRLAPGLLGDHRVIDTLLTLGTQPPDLGPAAARMRLVEPSSTLTRFLGSELAVSPLGAGRLPCWGR